MPHQGGHGEVEGQGGDRSADGRSAGPRASWGDLSASISRVSAKEDAAAGNKLLSPASKLSRSIIRDRQSAVKIRAGWTPQVRTRG